MTPVLMGRDNMVYLGTSTISNNIWYYEVDSKLYIGTVNKKWHMVICLEYKNNKQFRKSV